MSDAAGPPTRVRRDVDGILLLDKPGGLTSNRALQRVRGLYAARKAGHCGSLDPLATGMLPVCLGEATKVSGLLLGALKTYRVRARFGTATDTGDAEGRVVRTSSGTLDRRSLEAVLGRFRGPIDQVPPMYSALKQGGRRLYELAREGLEVPRAARRVEIARLEIEDFDPEAPVLTVRCSKGTYIRTLVEDLAAALNLCAHVEELRRLQVDPFPEGGMVTLDALQDAAAADPATLGRFLLPVDSGLDAWPRIELDGESARRLRQGQAVPAPASGPPGLVRVYDETGCFMGLGDRGPDGRVSPRRLMRVA